MPRNERHITLYVIWSAILLLSCGSDPELPVTTPPETSDGDLTHISYDPQPFELNIPEGYPEMIIPEDNPMTVSGVELGRHLFYDPILSVDSSMACASCHLPQSSFTDNLPVSPGVDGIVGKRSAMSLLNVGFVNTGLFWDGRVATLEEQALIPVEDPIELHHMWPDVIEDLRAHERYPRMFREAFGISNTNEIDKFLAAKALAQFQRTIISSGQSKFDRVTRRERVVFTDAEQRGHDIFFDIGPDRSKDAECEHCHAPPLFTTNEFLNNGIQDAATLDDFQDPGRGAVTGVRFDNGRFRVPTLINIHFSAPYMHRGQFNTIDEVIDHYITGGHILPNLDGNMRPLNLTEEEQQDLKAFLTTLIDTQAINNPALQNPFLD